MKPIRVIVAAVLVLCCLAEVKAGAPIGIRLQRRGGRIYVPSKPVTIDSSPIIEPLNKALKALGSTDRDYDGHREKAIYHIGAAIRHMETPNAKGKSNAAVEKAADGKPPVATKTATTPQAASDESLHKAKKNPLRGPSPNRRPRAFQGPTQSRRRYPHRNQGNLRRPQSPQIPQHFHRPHRDNHHGNPWQARQVTRIIALARSPKEFREHEGTMRDQFGFVRGFVVACVVSSLASCAKKDDTRVVVYSSLDREFSESILKGYQTASGVRVDAKYDVESTKTIGLVQLLTAERDRPRCDLFWNNEVVNTLRLGRKALLAPFEPPNAAAFPPVFKAKNQTWYGLAARARILIVNTKLVPEADRPKGLNDLIDPKWKGKIGIAKPLFGTTATHAACLFATWGPNKASDYFRALKANGVHVFSGNKQVATAVGAGEILFGLTDTDDAIGEVDAGRPVSIIYPDRDPGALGTLFIPNTLAVIKGAPHPAAAAALANYLLSPPVETALAIGPSAQIPLNPAVTVSSKVETPKTVTPMTVDWDAAVDAWDAAMSFLAIEFAG